LALPEALFVAGAGFEEACLATQASYAHLPP
jgi:hypothetical protein